jgi:hypothetical protein
VLIFFENYEPHCCTTSTFAFPTPAFAGSCSPLISNPDRVRADYTILADPAKWTVTLAMLKNEITKVTKGPRRIWVVVILRRMHAYVPALATTHLHLRSSQIYGHTFLKSLE